MLSPVPRYLEGGYVDKRAPGAEGVGVSRENGGALSHGVEG